MAGCRVQDRCQASVMTPGAEFNRSKPLIYAIVRCVDDSFISTSQGGQRSSPETANTRIQCF